MRQDAEATGDDDGALDEGDAPRLCTGTYFQGLSEDASLASERAGEAARRGMAMGLDMTCCVDRVVDRVCDDRRCLRLLHWTAASS